MTPLLSWPSLENSVWHFRCDLRVWAVEIRRFVKQNFQVMVMGKRLLTMSSMQQFQNLFHSISTRSARPDSTPRWEESASNRIWYANHPIGSVLALHCQLAIGCISFYGDREQPCLKSWDIDMDQSNDQCHSIESILCQTAPEMHHG